MPNHILIMWLSITDSHLPIGQLFCFQRRAEELCDSRGMFLFFMLSFGNSERILIVLIPVIEYTKNLLNHVIFGTLNTIK